ncbi:MAG: hypothetical protein M9899_02210 [Bdellovibrionaceae bacterium]|nr:hypothetical protein [Pseudobdellovibrionaceae bacterium]
MKVLSKSLIIMMSVLFIFAGCSKTEFSGTSVEDQDNSIDLPETVVYSFDRDINTTSNVDMIWVVDNSVSMVEEIQIIRENIGKFLLSVEDRSKLNFTLITNNKGSHGMALSEWALSRGYRQIVQYINSRDGLVQFLKLLPQMIGKSLRFDSKKVIVIVSDDNSEISSNVFLLGLSKLLDLAHIKIFGFIGIDKKISPCIDNPGSQYIKLAQATNGNIFNICESDWTPHFESLIKDVGQITKTEFTLPVLPKGEIIVKIDGVTITNFILDGLNLVIHPDNFPTNKKYKIDVVYLQK